MCALSSSRDNGEQNLPEEKWAAGNTKDVRIGELGIGCDVLWVSATTVAATCGGSYNDRSTTNKPGCVHPLYAAWVDKTPNISEDYTCDFTECPSSGMLSR